MPKKRIEYRGRLKHFTERSEEYPFVRDYNEFTDENYTTIADYERNQKYSKRPIESNWSRYEANVSDFRVEPEDEIPQTDDFNNLLKTASSDCSYFEFNSEKLWKTENNPVPNIQIFNLDLNILSKGLACVPFYDLMGLKDTEITAKDKKKFDEVAENNKKEYDSMMEKTIKKLENLDIAESKTPAVRKIDKLEESIYDMLGVPDVKLGSEGSGKKLFFSENEEDLEDWLDSILDD